MSDWTGQPPPDLYPPDGFLTGGVLVRRCIAWAIDAVVVGLLLWALTSVLLLFGALTFGAGLGALTLLPLVPFVYNMVSLLSARSGTPGQQMMGLTVRRNDDLGPPTALQAVLSTLIYELTLATSGLLLLVSLFTARKRTLHDLVSGLVVVRVRAMDALTAPPGPWNMYGGTTS
jgi:uncharacterized RDD family membrane protein YckC